MNALPLPNEIIRIIYQFIHPIFEYQKFRNALKQYDDDRCELDNILKYKNNMTNELHYFNTIASYSRRIAEKIKYIETFLQINKPFYRPDYVYHLKKGQYKTKWEYEYNKNRVEKWDDDMMSMKNLMYSLHVSSIHQLEYLCRINNISIIVTNKQSQYKKRYELIQKLLKI